MNNLIEKYNKGLGGPKPKGFGSGASPVKSPAAPASLPPGGGLPVFEKRVQLKEALPEVARGSPMRDGSPPRAIISPEPDLPRRQTLKSPTPLPKMRTPRELASRTGGSPPESAQNSAASGWRSAAPSAYGVNAAASMGPGSPSLAPMGGGASTRSNMSGLPISQRTSSPSGRMHPNPTRRAELRKADMFNNIDYYGGHGAPDNDRLVKEASWLSTQSWFESLRYYPQGEDADDDEAAYSGLTHGMAAPTEHLETDVRTRLGIAKADADWVPDQLQMQWLPESEKLLRRLRKSYLKLRR